ncbi:peptidoglycan recognition protein 3-like [Ornithorhynchus anatinus]|uniref:peptidoglycan recognition protein 3-like n=1 Tax=Ornithorhynchus anatinus TaxID=9258 RepID=UPI0010A752F6|nr:peptidoglycan recognition protein 3-like [Ornithorhynchus anatinus]
MLRLVVFLLAVGVRFSASVPPAMTSHAPQPSTAHPNATDTLARFETLLGCFRDVFQDPPTITPRAEWGAQAPRCTAPLKTPTPYLLVHHIAGTDCGAQGSSWCLRQLQDHHTLTNGWCDIAYNFLIMESGEVFEGTGWTVQGHHTAGYNEVALGFAFFTNMTDRAPSQAALASAQHLISFAVQKRHLSPNYIQPFLFRGEDCLQAPGSTPSGVLGCPTIIPRADWGAKGSMANCRKLDRPAKYVIIIHTAGQPCTELDSCKELVRGIQDFHVNGRKFCDVGYNFLVGEDGNVYEGVGWDTEGAHTYGYNDIALGVAFLGLFEDKPPNAAALMAAQRLIRCSVDRDYLDPNYLLVAHSDVINSISPGRATHDIIKTWPHFKG